MSLTRTRSIAGGVVALAAAALVLSGCASASGDTTETPSAAVDPAVTAELEQYSAPVAAEYEGAPFSTAAAEGSTVWWVTFYSGNPFLAAVGASFAEALESQGVTVVTCDGKGNPVDVNACIAQGVAQGAAAIQVDGPEPETFSNSLEAANSAGIPVLSGAAVDASNELYEGLAAQSSQPFELTGELAADWIINDSGGNANVLFLTVPDVIGSTQEEDAFSARMAEMCSSCTVTVEGVTLANWATDLATTTSAALLRDAGINYVVPAFDPMTQFVAPAIQQAGKSSAVQVVTVNGSLQQMQDLAADTIAAEIGIDLNALGYIEADQVLRVLTENEPVAVAYAPVRIFDASNIGTITLDEASRASGAWFVESGSYSDIFTGTIWTD